MPDLSELSSILSSRGIAASFTSDILVSGVSSDSRKIIPGDIFAALPGRSVDGAKFVDQASERGAVAVLSGDGRVEFNLPTLQVSDLSSALGIISDNVFQSECTKKTAFGVTGTNGKTSVCYLLAQAMAYLKGAAVYGGTLGLAEISRDGESHFSDTETTTPISTDFHRFLGQNRHIAGFAVEVSSMALHQRRLEGLELDSAVFTNLTRDHLDYHGTMESYLEAKKLLFTRDLLFSGKKQKVAVLNIGDEVVRGLAPELRSLGLEVWGYALVSTPDLGIPTLTVTQAQIDGQGIEFKFRFRGDEYSVRSRLIGRYNVENLLAVITALLSVGMRLEDILQITPKLRGVPGRLERVALKGGTKSYPTVLVDYAHTPDALEKALSSVREICSGRLISVFGCGGDRDRGKRPLMGEVASRLSDVSIVTSDNPRTEDPAFIISEILRGIRSGRQSEDIVDRRAAIARAVEIAAPGDTILIAGKGHEPYQEINGVRHHFLDREVAEEALIKVYGESS